MLSWPDIAIMLIYLGGMLAVGVAAGRRQRSAEDYFLGSRSMPWLVIGVSIVASLLSSLTYLAEPGEVWKSGVTHVAGKLAGIPIGLALVWWICVPRMVRLRLTSVYEILGTRFGPASRRLGVVLFVVMMVLWMGFVVRALSGVFHRVTDVPLWVVVTTVGIVATIYTVMGGLRAVVWTDVLQAAFLAGGALITTIAIGVMTGSTPFEWLSNAREHVISIGQHSTLAWFSWDPTVRATIVTVAINMAVWQLCMHTSNQVTVQRYFSTTDLRAARRSLVVSGIVYVVINVLLVMVGIAVLYYYTGARQPLDPGLDPTTDRDLIFPMFALRHLPPGLGGAILVALLAAAMSSVDSGANSIAVVLTVEFRGKSTTGGGTDLEVRRAKKLTLIAGLAITIAAYALSYLPAKWGIVGAIPRTFNAITGPLGGLFLLAIFTRRVGDATAVAATVIGLIASVAMGYAEQIGQVLTNLGVAGIVLPEFSYTWILPISLATTVIAGVGLSWLRPR